MSTRDNEPQDNTSEPSFDELLGFAPTPSVPPSTPAAAPDQPVVAGAPAQPVHDAAPQEQIAEFSATPSTAANEPDPFAELFGDALEPSTHDSGTAPAQGLDFWSRPTAAEDEHLEPLILPGFSSEPIVSEPKPPVFQTTPPPAGPETQSFIEPAPTEKLTPVTLAASAAASEPAAPEPAPAAPAVPAVPAAPEVPEQIAPQPVVSEPAASPAVAPESSLRPNPSATEDAFAAAMVATGGSGISGQEPYEKISVTGGEKRGRKVMPWVVVASTVTVAIVAALFAVNVLAGGGSETPPAPTPSPTPTPTPAPKPTPDTSEEKAQEAEAEAESTGNTPPKVDVGEVWKVDITQWNISVDVSQRLGGMNYALESNSKAMLTLPLAESLPESCAAARTGWGLQRQGESNKFTAIRPEPRCTNPADAAVYDTIWGLVDAMAKSARPMG